MSDTQKRWLAFGIVVLAVLIAGFLGVKYPIPEPPLAEDLTTRAMSMSFTRFRSVLVDHELTADDITVSDDLAVTDDLTVTGLATVGETLAVTGAADFASTLQHGTDNLYALGHATTGKQIACGTTGTFTDSTDLAVSALSSIDGIVLTQITTPAATGELLYVSAISGYTATVKSVESDYTVGTTGVNAYYCAVGNQ